MHTKLLRSQRNEIFALAKKAGLEPRDFAWSEVEPRWETAGALVERITHKPTGYFFTFDRYERDANPVYSPSKQRAAEKDAGRMTAWETVFGHVAQWVSALKDEVLEPDLWNASSDDKKLVAASIDDLDNSPFTHQEQERVAAAIGEIRNFLHSTADYSVVQLGFIDARLRHLEEASTRLGRKDWITLAMGTLTNIVVGVALAPEAARELVRTAGALLGWVVGGVQLLL